MKIMKEAIMLMYFPPNSYIFKEEKIGLKQIVKEIVEMFAEVME